MIVPAMAQAMTVADFLAKTEALKAKGILAMGSPDITVLRNEIKGAGTAYRAKIDADVAAGRKPGSCPPPKGTANVTSDDIIAEFSRIPVAQRSKTSVETAFAAFMTKRYPCKA
ncbi:MAG: hypothetical protein B7Y47_06160 [Sphingomonas sp. 28-63-12]|nr:MAG: hypothetical protein B7Y47_06160 [Sphingomonas sp. 28-63-12]